jgi:VanZ family protein
MSKFLRWFPALIMMFVIYFSSATPSSQIPNYGNLDLFVKKGGHMTGYALLSIAFWYGFNFEKKKSWLAWLFALLYAASDEFHQSFTSGRHPSWVDILLYDNGGAILGLGLQAAWFQFRSQKKNLQKPT